MFRAFETGNDAFQQCKKIVDTPFPYPYAQMVLWMLCLCVVGHPHTIYNCACIQTNGHV